jgi:cytidylate kinase
MTVIAMTREMGTLGKDVAAGLADKLGIEVVHHELVEQQLAERLNTNESAVSRFLEGKASMWERWKIDGNKFSRYTAEEVLELAMRGNVLIRGWGAAQLLRDIPHVICLRVCAPMDRRIQEMKQRLGVDSTDVAQREIERSDDGHARGVQRQFHRDWRDPTGYDLVINTAYVPIQVGVAVVQQMAKSGAYEPTDESRGRLLDKLLEARIRSTLDERIADSPIGSGLNVTVSHGRVVVSGVVEPGSKVQQAIDEIRKIEGVTAVTNETINVKMDYGP